MVGHGMVGSLAIILIRPCLSCARNYSEADRDRRRALVHSSVTQNRCRCDPGIESCVADWLMRAAVCAAKQRSAGKLDKLG